MTESRCGADGWMESCGYGTIYYVRLKAADSDEAPAGESGERVRDSRSIYYGSALDN